MYLAREPMSDGGAAGAPPRRGPPGAWRAADDAPERYQRCEAMYTSCRDQAPVEYVRGSLLVSTDGLPQWNPSTVHTRYVVQ